MRKFALAGIAAGLAAAMAAAPLGARAQETPRLDVPPRAEPSAVNPNDPYPNPPPPEDLAKDQAQAKGQAPARPKITGGLVAEAGGGVAGGLLAKGVGTAVAGPVGGFAASWIGSTLGGKAVHMVRRWFGHDKPAEAARPPAVEASTTAPTREAEAPN